MLYLIINKGDFMSHSIQINIDSDFIPQLPSITKKHNIDFKFIGQSEFDSGGNPLYEFSSKIKSNLQTFISTYYDPNYII